MRKAIAVVAVLAMLVLGGCSGGGGPSSDSASGSARGRATPQGTTGTTKAPATEGTKGAGRREAKAGSDASASGGKGRSHAQASGEGKAGGGKGQSHAQASGEGKASGGKGLAQASAGAGRAKKSTGSSATGAPQAAPGSSATGAPQAASGSSAGQVTAQDGSSAASGNDGRETGPGDAEVPQALPITGEAAAARRYQEIDDAYTASLRDLLKALGKRPLNMTAVRVGVRKSAAGYEARLDSLRAVRWSSDVQPTVDKFVELASTTGHRMFAEMEKAQTPADLSGRANEPDVRKLRSAEMGMRSAVGLANPTAG